MQRLVTMLGRWQHAEPELEIAVEFVDVSLAQLSEAKLSYRTCRHPSMPLDDVLVVAFEGTAANRREYSGTYDFMKAMIAAGLAAWEPIGLVLDLRRLSYEWGDEMAGVLGFGRDQIPRSSDQLRPVAVVVSDLNREGLTSLVAEEMGFNPCDWLFESIDDALAAIGPELSRNGY